MQDLNVIKKSRNQNHLGPIDPNKHIHYTDAHCLFGFVLRTKTSSSSLFYGCYSSFVVLSIFKPRFFLSKKKNKELV